MVQKQEYLVPFVGKTNWEWLYLGPQIFFITFLFFIAADLIDGETKKRNSSFCFTIRRMVLLPTPNRICSCLLESPISQWFIIYIFSSRDKTVSLHFSLSHPNIFEFFLYTQTNENRCTKYSTNQFVNSIITASQHAKLWGRT